MAGYLAEMVVERVPRRRHAIYVPALVIASTLALAACSSNGSASGSGSGTGTGTGSSVTTLTVPEVSPTEVVTPAFMVHDLGLDAKNGIKVDFIKIDSSASTDLYISGKMKFGIISPGSVAAILAADRKLNVYAVSGDRSVFSVYSNDTIKSMSDLAGKGIGTTKTGGLPESTMQAILPKYGVDPSKVTYVPLGNEPGDVAGVTSGKIPATVLSAAGSYVAEQRGLNRLLRISDTNFKSPNLPIVGDPDWVKSHESAAIGYLKAYLEASWIYLTDPTQGKKELAKFIGLDPTKDASQLDFVYQASLTTIANPTTIGDVKDVYEQYFPLYPKPVSDHTRALPADDLYAKIKSSGFLDQLQKKYGAIPSSVHPLVEGG